MVEEVLCFVQECRDKVGRHCVQSGGGREARGHRVRATEKQTVRMSILRMSEIGGERGGDGGTGGARAFYPHDPYLR
jgi:hypothetical protein